MRGLVLAGALVAAMPAPASPATLKPRTAAVFDKYVSLSEARMDAEIRSGTPFIWAEGLPASRLREVEARLRRGEVVVERLRTREGGRGIDPPDGIIHHWVGVVFVPGVTADAAVALMQDYDRHSRIFQPNVVDSRTLSRDGQRFRLFLRFYMKKVLAVTLNTESEAEFVRLGEGRAYSRIRSTRVAEVADAGTSKEHEKPVGNDNGFMWRLNTYWRFLERDEGTYVQCESITLSRDIPFGLGWIIRPFITEVPKDSLTFTLGRTRRQLIQDAGAAQESCAERPFGVSGGSMGEWCPIRRYERRIEISEQPSERPLTLPPTTPLSIEFTIRTQH
ncbi:MAG TPA: hypothetical protein VK886_18860 [Vicinamibacterales bacterium]|nr:hypothetical protein [Vicinamibacterales bacterium]